jgi:hypothetical protein
MWGPTLWAVTPEISKFLNKENRPFYTASRITWLPFPDPLVCQPSA